MRHRGVVTADRRFPRLEPVPFFASLLSFSKHGRTPCLPRHDVPKTGHHILPPSGIHTLPSAPRRTSLGRRVDSSPYWRLPGAPARMPQHRQRSISAVSTRKNSQSAHEWPTSAHPKAQNPKWESSRIPTAPQRLPPPSVATPIDCQREPQHPPQPPRPHPRPPPAEKGPQGPDPCSRCSVPLNW